MPALPPAGDRDYWFSGGVHHYYLRRNRAHTQFGAAESAFRITIAMIGFVLNLAILIGICMSRSYHRPIVIIVFNLTFINFAISFFYIPVYAFGFILDLQDDSFCLGIVSVFRELTAVALTSQMIFSFHMLCTAEGRTDLFTPLKTVGYIVLAWLFNLLCYVSPVFVGIGISHIQLHKSDSMCSNFTRDIRESFSIHPYVNKLFAVYELLLQAMQFLTTCFIIVGIHRVILRGKHERQKSPICKKNYSRVSRTTGYFLICFLVVWTPLITINLLVLLGYEISYAAAHSSLDLFFLSPILVATGMIFGVRSVRSDVGKCCSAMCCLDFGDKLTSRNVKRQSSSYSTGLRSDAIHSGDSVTSMTASFNRPA